MNFYKPHIPNGVVNVPSFEAITYKDIYPNMDVAVIKKEGGVEFEITMRPGANPDDFKLNFNGSSDIVFEQNGDMRVNRPLGQTRFEIPRGRKIIGGKELPVSVTLIKDENNLVGLSIINFQTGKTFKITIGERKITPILPIDNFNRLYWSTYYSGTQTIFEDQCFGTHIDANDNIYYTGLTWTSDFPLFLNTQTIFGGDRDAYVVKFNTLRGREFSTYYGGSDYESGADVKTDASGSVYFTGTTTSANFTTDPSGSAYLQNTLNGSFDAFIIKLNSTGVRTWATFFGGDGSESGSSLALDLSNNLYLVGAAGSPVNFPFQNLAGAYNQTTAGYGFISKFNADGSQAWATLYNGAVHSCAINSLGNLIVVGQTNLNGSLTCSPGTDFPLCDPGNGAYVMNNGGGADAFVSRFNNSGVLQWSTQFGGSGDESTSNLFYLSGRHTLVVDNANNILIAGPTSSSDLDVMQISGNSNAFYQDTYGGGLKDGYIARFTNNGNQTWGTYFGGASNDEITGMALAGSDLYIIGSTVSSDIYTKLLPGSYNQLNFGGGLSDGFLIYLQNYVPEWSTYFGGSAVEAPDAIAVSNSHIIVGGRTGGTLPTKNIIGTNDYFNGTYPGHESSFFADFKEGSVYNSGPKTMLNIESSNNEVKIYPNPATENFIIENAENSTVKIFSISGQIIFESLVNSKIFPVNINGFAKGMYVIEISSSVTETTQQKLIIE